MGAAVNFDPGCLAIVVSSQNFKSKHTGVIVQLHCEQFSRQFKELNLPFLEKILSRKLPGLVAATRRGALFDTRGSSIKEFTRYLQSEQQEASHNMHSP